MQKTHQYVYGLHSVHAVLTYQAQQVYVLYVQQGVSSAKLAGVIALAVQQGIAVERVNKSQLDLLTEQGNHQGVTVRVKPAVLAGEQELFADLAESTSIPLLLLLDEIQDPHNLGACLRTAAAAGVSAVVLPRMRAVSMTATVRKVASGAAEMLSIYTVANLVRCMREIKQLGIWLVGAAVEAPQTLYSADLTGPLGLVVGNEANGLRRLTAEHCDVLTAIPMAEGTVASLNVSVATGICLFEARRQRAQVNKPLSLSSHAKK